MHQVAQQMSRQCEACIKQHNKCPVNVKHASSSKQMSRQCEACTAQQMSRQCEACIKQHNKCPVNRSLSLPAMEHASSILEMH